VAILRGDLPDHIAADTTEAQPTAALQPGEGQPK
jgi:hypothetical protein